MDIRISIIIPAFNAEKHINNVFKSVKNQTQLPFELIIVDDGSIDQTPRICDELCKQYSWVRTVHKSNGGLSSARNAGIKQASGTHIIFVDADDYIEAESVKTVTKYIEQYNPDLLDFGMYYVDPNKNKNSFHNKLPKNQVFGEEMITERIIPVMINVRDDKDAFIYDYSVNKVYRTDILKTNQILFDENRRIWEDRPFVVHYLKYCKTYISSDAYLYNYCFTEGSLSQKFKLELFDIVPANYKFYKDLFGEQYDFCSQVSYNYWSAAIERIIVWGLQQKSGQEEIRNRILENLTNDEIVNWFKNRDKREISKRITSFFIERGYLNSAIHFYKASIWFNKCHDLKSRSINIMRRIKRKVGF